MVYYDLRDNNVRQCRSDSKTLIKLCIWSEHIVKPVWHYKWSNSKHVVTHIVKHMLNINTIWFPISVNGRHSNNNYSSLKMVRWYCIGLILRSFNETWFESVWLKRIEKDPVNKPCAKIQWAYQLHDLITGNTFDTLW